MGVLQDREQITHSHDMPMTALFTEIENSNILSYTNHCQYCDSDQCRTVDPFSLYVYYKNNDQGNVIDRIEERFSVKQSATAYKTSATTLMEELRKFSNPAQHTRIMVFLRALIFSKDATTQTQTANTGLHVQDPGDSLKCIF